MGNVTAKTSGEIASFMTPAKTNIKSLKVYFSPKQLGTSDPSPENVREIVGWDGVEADEYNSDFKFIPIVKSNTSLGVTWTINDSGLVIAEGTPTSWSNCLIGYIKVNGDETIQGFIYGSLNNVIISKPKLYDSDDKEISFSASDSILLHGLDLSQYKDVKKVGIVLKRNTNNIYMSGSCYVVVKKIENINDIHKTTIPINWTKNIKQWTYIDATIDDSYSSNNFNGYGNGRWDNVIADIPSEWFGKELTYSAYIERSSSPLNNYDDVRVWCYGDSTTLFDAKTAQRIYTAEESGRSWVTFTIPEGTTKIGLGLYLSKGSRAYNPQLEYGSEPTEYQPYVGTVYGGYVDLISGELVEEYYSVIENGQKSWSFNNYNDNYYRAFITPSTLEVPNPIINSNKQFYNISLKGSDTTKFNGWIGSTGNFLFYLPQSLGITTKDEWANFLSINPLQICYPLATPITYQLTPTQLSSFIGQNNFWSNADYVEIEYELKETEDIQKCRKKIMLNQPHTESVISDVANFTTNMKAPLKECKVYFNPIQEGSGDPSPDNVRNIIGWDGVNLYKCKKNLVLESSIIDNFYVRGAVTQTGTEIGSVYKLSGYKCTDFIKVLPNTTYTITFTWINATAAGLVFYSNAKVEDVISGISMETMKKSPYTFTTPSNCNYIRFTSRYLDSFMGLVQGSTGLTEEIYDGTNIFTTWSDNVGTVYGGYVDLAKGELVAEWEIAQGRWGDIKSFAAVSSTGYYTGKLNYSNTIKISHYQSSYYKNSICNITNTILWQTGEKTPEHFYCGNNSNTNKGEAYIFGNYDDDVTIQIIVKLAEPIHYSLTPQQLLTFKGENNIWSDTNGQTEVKFWIH